MPVCMYVGVSSFFFFLVLYLRVVKYGATPAAAGVGLGVGTYATGLGVKSALGSISDGAAESVSSDKKMTGWIFLIILVAIVLYLFWPQIKKMTNRR